ncbi:MAG: hypothetical protein E7117_05385 [Bacteroidales bacterium]|nr:hypothetical protein [Bacteroidales bacterium]
MKKTLCFLMSAALLGACNVEPADSDCNAESELSTIYASLEYEPEVKNVIDNATFKTTWLSGDAINVFFGASESSRFVTSESGEVVRFKGSIDVITGGGEGLTDETSLWGIYPYDPGNICDGQYVTLTLSCDQAAAENTFAPGLFPQVARSRNFYMTFYNLCACIRFTVANTDIRSVKLSGNDGEPIAGKVKVSMEGAPAVVDVLSPETELVMHAPEGECFVPGVNYYFVLYPTTFSNGLKMTYYKEGSYASYTYAKPYTLERNKVSRFTDRDDGLIFKSIPLNDWENGGNINGEI